MTLLENLRYNPGEEGNDDAFVRTRRWPRPLTSTTPLARRIERMHRLSVHLGHLPSAAGRLLAREVEVCSASATRLGDPLVAVMGGAKVSDKLGVIEALLGIVDSIIVGGGMAFTFLKAQGYEVGDSLLEDDMVETCGRLLQGLKTIHLPIDVTAPKGGKLFDPAAGGEVRQAGVNLAPGWMGVDIGPETAGQFSDVIDEAGTVLWNGPMGVFEDERSVAGTATIAHAIAESRAFTVVGGGDLAAAAKQFGVDGDVDHMSTGGAPLELIEQGDLPGLAALREGTK
ncbi:MAG: phosphoglycerate kinase [Acidimicrobiales bacterium]